MVNRESSFALLTLAEVGQIVFIVRLLRCYSARVLRCYGKIFTSLRRYIVTSLHDYGVLGNGCWVLGVLSLAAVGFWLLTVRLLSLLSLLPCPPELAKVGQIVFIVRVLGCYSDTVFNI